MSTITPEMKKFLHEFSQLLHKHKAVMEVTTKDVHYSTLVKGIEVYTEGIYDSEGNCLRDTCTVQLPTDIDYTFILDVFPPTNTPHQLRQQGKLEPKQQEKTDAISK